MAKNPNEKSMKRDNSLYGAILFFFAACLAELYLLVLRKYYIHGYVEQVLAWDDRLKIFAGAGVVLLAAGIGLNFLWKAEFRKRLASWAVAGLGVFFAGGSVLIRMYYESAVTLLSVVVPVVMVLSVLWAFYDRECSVALTILSMSLIVLWVCRRLFNSLTLGMPVKVLSVVYILLLGGLCWLAKNGKFSKLLPNADFLPIYLSVGLSAVAVVLSLFSASVAFYAMWGLGIVLFALWVYYTVKQL